jgi:hypothetical protein
LPFRVVSAKVDLASAAESLSVLGGKKMAMRRYLVLSVLGVCVLAFAPAATAIGSSSTYYAGTNSQGQKLLFSVDQTASGPQFDPVFTTVIDRCPATGDVITIQFSFTGFQIPIRNGKFSLALNDLSDRFSWTGTVTPKKASGKESYGLAAFDNENGLQNCATGSLSWKAPALVPASSRAAAPGASYIVTVSKAADGSVHYSVSHG